MEKKENTKTTKEVVLELVQDIESKGFTTMNVEESDFDNTIKVVIRSINNNKYGASIKSIKYLESINNIGHWNEEGKSEWYSHSKLCGCSQSAISWLIDQAKSHKGIDFDLILVNV